MNQVKLIELLLHARCPDSDCDGYGTVQGAGPGMEAICCGSPLPSGECCGNPVEGRSEGDGCEACQWCHERAELLDRKDLLSPPVDTDVWNSDPDELPF